MRKITVEYDEGDSSTGVMFATDAVLRNCESKLKPDENIKIVLDKGLKSGVITQRGVCVPFMESKR